MRNVRNYLIPQIFAGIMIAIGCLVYCNGNGGVINAILFSFGLVSIFLLDLRLYTGVIGFCNNAVTLLGAFWVLVGNIIGVSFLMLLQSPYACEMMVAKLSQNLGITFLKAILCGIIIYTCVRVWKNKGLWQFSLLGVPAFILSGAEHSVADIGYVFLAKSFSWRALAFILIVVIGNAIGSIATHKLLSKERRVLND